ncbi:hypothetical protein ACFL1U_00200 [Patescibacteria group bacterium]
MATQFSIGLMNRFASVLNSLGFTSKDLTKLIQTKEILRGLKAVLRGTAEFKFDKRFIDCDAEPATLQMGWKIRKHKKQGWLEWNPSKIKLFLSKKQHKESASGRELYKELSRMPVLNANVLDHLLQYPELIPEEWNGKEIFFWGTIYENTDGTLLVRCLGGGMKELGWDCGCVDDDWGNTHANPAAVLKQ